MMMLLWLGDDRWRLGTPMLIEWRGRELRVPAGTPTDLASVPWWARWLISVTGPHARATVAHDYLYQQQPAVWARAEADALLRDVAVHDGTARWRAWLMWAAARVGGGRWRQPWA